MPRDNALPVPNRNLNDFAGSRQRKPLESVTKSRDFQVVNIAQEFRGILSSLFLMCGILANGFER
jgi:hypothetical protein